MTVSTKDVHRALLDLGSLRFGETDVQEAMSRIATTTHTIFDVDGAGLLLIGADDRLRTAASSDDRVTTIEQLQVEHDEGPCLDAYAERQLVCSQDLADERRWPTFAPAAVRSGLRSVLASPIPFNQDAIGVVVVVSADARAWTPEAELALVAFTDLAALLIASMLMGQQQSQLTEQLHTALHARTAIEQAKGLLVARGAGSPQQAYAQLRATARSQRRRIDDVARELLESPG